MTVVTYRENRMNTPATAPTIGQGAVSKAVPADDAWQFAGTCDEPGRIRGRCVGHCITIEAPPELVWSFVADFTGWSRWSRLYAQTYGRVETGGTLHFTAHFAGLKPRKGAAQVCKVAEYDSLEFAEACFAGLLRSQRYVEIEELSPLRCRVINGEIVGGLLGPLVPRAIGAKIAAGLQDMNEALKEVSERKWRGLGAF
jgi:hypothetical protein